MGIVHVCLPLTIYHGYVQHAVASFSARVHSDICAFPLLNMGGGGVRGCQPLLEPNCLMC